MFLVASDGRTDVGCDCVGMAGGSASFFHGTLRYLLPILHLDFRVKKCLRVSRRGLDPAIPFLQCCFVLLFKGSGACHAFRLLVAACQCRQGRTQGNWVIFWLSQIRLCAVLSALRGVRGASEFLFCWSGSPWPTSVGTVWWRPAFAVCALGLPV